MRITSQSGKAINECNRIYIVDHINEWNEKDATIEGQLMESDEKVILGRYRNNDQAKQIIKLLSATPALDVFIMPQENFEDSDNFFYPDDL